MSVNGFSRHKNVSTNINFRNQCKLLGYFSRKKETIKTNKQQQQQTLFKSSRNCSPPKVSPQQCNGILLCRSEKLKYFVLKLYTYLTRSRKGPETALEKIIWCLPV